MRRILAGSALLLLAACTTPAPLQGAPIAPTAAQLAGTEWRLEDLAGTGVLDRVEATLVFAQDGRLAGRGSCNRFGGSWSMDEPGALKVSQLATTRMACPPAVMEQERKYLAALQSAERVTTEGPWLYVHVTALARPLKFVRSAP